MSGRAGQTTCSSGRRGGATFRVAGRVFGPALGLGLVLCGWAFVLVGPAASQEGADAAEAVTLETTVDPGVAALANRANALRDRIEAGVGDEAARRAIFAELRGVGAEAFALSPREDRDRVLLHLARSLALLEPAREGDPTRAEEGTEGSAVPRPLVEPRRLRSAWLAAVAESAASRDDLALAAHARLERARLYAEAGRPAESMTLALRAVAEAAQAEDELGVARGRAWVGRLRWKGGDRPGAIEAMRGAVRSYAGLRAGLGPGGADRLDFQAEVEPAYRRLAAYLLEEARASGTSPGSEGAGPVALDAALARLHEARDVIEGLKQAELRDYYEDDCLSGIEIRTPDEIPGTVVVYPILLPDRLELVVSRDGRMSSHVHPIGRDALESLATRFRRGLEDRMTHGYRRAGAALYDALIRPIASRLAEGPVDTIVFVPDGGLRQIPMAALWDAEAKQFLIEQYAVAITPGLQLTEPRPLPREDVTALVGALTESVQGYAALPNVAQEVERIDALYESRAFVDAAFRTEAYAEALRERPFEIVHIASHGEFRADARESYVLTWDGRLSLDRLGALIEATRFRTERPLEMLVLSACETAVGDDRAALGLAGAAVRMGARSVVATLWSVNDLASSQLVAALYEGLAESGSSRAQALRAAQLRLLEQRDFRHPANWAPFLLVSSWL